MEVKAAEVSIACRTAPAEESRTPSCASALPFPFLFPFPILALPIPSLPVALQFTRREILQNQEARSETFFDHKVHKKVVRSLYGYR